MAKKVIKDLLKKAMSNGDKSSAAQSYKSMARGAVSSMLPKTNVLKNALSKGDKSSAAQAFKSMVAKKAKPNTVKIDSTKKVTPSGSSKPSVMIKKQTTIKPSSKKPLLHEFDKMPSKMKKRFENWDKGKKVEYKPFPKK